MAIKFKYTLPEKLQPLVKETVADYGLNYVYGLMPEELVGQLRHCSLFLVCEHENTNIQLWRNPMAVVAMNISNAIETYYQFNGSTNASVLCEIVNRCDKIKVEKCN